MTYDKKQREMIIAASKGKVVESLEYVEADEYWVMNFDDGSEISFRFTAELI